MKKRAPAFGHAEMLYRLDKIFSDAAAQFAKLDKEIAAGDKEYKKTKDFDLSQKLFSLSAQRIEFGAVTLITAVAWLEQMLYGYATHFFDQDSYDNHCGSLRLVSKWILLPRLCQNKDISEDHPAINNLRELIAARNAVIHPKRQIMLDPILAINRVDKEQLRFTSACRKATKTVADLRAILEKPVRG